MGCCRQGRRSQDHVFCAKVSKGGGEQRQSLLFFLSLCFAAREREGAPSVPAAESSCSLADRMAKINYKLRKEAARQIVLSPAIRGGTVEKMAICPPTLSSLQGAGAGKSVAAYQAALDPATIGINRAKHIIRYVGTVRTRGEVVPRRSHALGARPCLLVAGSAGPGSVRVQGEMSHFASGATF